MPYLPAYCQPAAYAAFLESLGTIHRAEGLFRAAAAVSLHAYPEASVDDTFESVAKLAGVVRTRVRARSDQAMLAHLHDVLFEVAAFRGAATDYYNPANSYVTEVLRTRVGIPITLSLVYRTVASLVGLEAEGVNAPGHFLTSVTVNEARQRRTLYVDPFHGGSLLNEGEALRLISDATGRDETATPGALRVATPTDWLARILRNLQAIFAQRGEERDLWAMQELAAALAEQ